MKQQRPARAIKRRNRSALTLRKARRDQRVEFSQVKGRTVEKIEMNTAVEYHSIRVEFQDKTALNLVLEPGFQMFASFESLKTGDIQVMKQWPPIRSASERE
ncbi:MAG: hypothetical protein LAP21_19690 [Acidobacteriia bacterium]|nr:hypothetical protein [Terriglobia bacterium]